MDIGCLLAGFCSITNFWLGRNLRGSAAVPGYHAACAIFHDDALRLRWNRHERKTIFRLLLQKFGQTLGSMPQDDHHTHAAAWRFTVESWLRCQGLIVILQYQQPKVSTTSPNTWSHN